MTTDTEILDWIEQHLDETYTVGTPNEDYTVIRWSDKEDKDCSTYGDDLRDAVIKAINKVLKEEKR